MFRWVIIVYHIVFSFVESCTFLVYSVGYNLYNVNIRLCTKYAIRLQWEKEKKKSQAVVEIRIKVIQINIPRNISHMIIRRLTLYFPVKNVDDDEAFMLALEHTSHF